MTYFCESMRYVVTFIIMLMVLLPLSSAGIVTRVRLYTDKKVYYLSEQVKIVLENKSKKTVYLPNPAPWTILDEEGNPVYAPVTTQVITPVKPGERKEWVWNQTTLDNATVTPGRYQVVLRTVSQVYYAYFKIVEKPPEEKKVRFWGVMGPLFIKVWKWDWGAWDFGNDVCCYGRVEGVNISYRGPFILRVEEGVRGWRWFGNIFSWIEGEGFIEEYFDETPVIRATNLEVERIDLWSACWEGN